MRTRTMQQTRQPAVARKGMGDPVADARQARTRTMRIVEVKSVRSIRMMEEDVAVDLVHAIIQLIQRNQPSQVLTLELQEVIHQ